MNTKLYVFLLLFLSFQAQAKRALMVIDPQDAFVVRNGNIMMRQNQIVAQQMQSNIIELMRRARVAKIPVYVIGFDGFGPIQPPIARELSANPRGILFWKWTDGAFDSGMPIREVLMADLESKGVDELIIAGANGRSCVMSTIWGALRLPRPMKITAVSSAIADYNLNPFIFPFRYGKLMERNSLFREVEELPSSGWMAETESAQNADTTQGTQIIVSDDLNQATRKQPGQNSCSNTFLFKKKGGSFE